MFGTFRWLLAHMVVLSHLWTSLTLWAGAYAVFSFWALSGYLMALVLDRTYGFSAVGVRRYLVNRALRIYPAYWATLVVVVPIVAAWPDLARSVSTVRLPDGALAWLRNLAILTTHLDREGTAGPVPPIWSVDIELCFYLAMPILARGRARIALWFAASLAWTAWMLWSDAPFNERYANLAAASLPYSAGALVYALREPLARWVAGRAHLALSLALFAAHAAFPISAFRYGLVLSLAATLYVIAAWGRVTPARLGTAGRRFARLDAALGDLSYPVFLCHWGMALLVLRLGLADGKGAALFFFSLPLVNLCAFAIHRLAEAPLERARDRVRSAR
jgi:peptidoglycan/LPS O-acetylase OafA/YrhL